MLVCGSFFLILWLEIGVDSAPCESVWLNNEPKGASIKRPVAI